MSRDDRSTTAGGGPRPAGAAPSERDEHWLAEGFARHAARWAAAQGAGAVEITLAQFAQKRRFGIGQA